MKEYNMKKLVNALLFTVFATVSASSTAEIRTVTLSVSGMT